MFCNKTSPLSHHYLGTNNKRKIMSPSSSRLVQKAERGAGHFNQKPIWLETFLKRTFFEACSTHKVRRNELNKYCVSCDYAACQYCVSLGPHKNHKLLKIYRHVYKDVVSLGAMEKYVDCTKIQPYKSNKRLVIALNPLPHCGPPTNSDKKTCLVCKRRLNEPNSYRYCSIACKVKAFSKKTGDSAPPFPSVGSPMKEKRKETSEPEKPEPKLRRRKGIPFRAPFF